MLNNMSFLRLVALPLILVTLIVGPLNKAMKDWVAESYSSSSVPTTVHKTTSEKLVEYVDTARVKILNDGEGKFAAQCLEQFPHDFDRAEKLTGIEQALLAGIAGYESAGCTKPKGGAGNVMHITTPSAEHLHTATRLLSISQETLNWLDSAEHSIVLGAVMFADYAARTKSVTSGLSAYRHGPKKASHVRTGDAYTREVIAHTILGRRFLLSQEADVPVAAEDRVEITELPRKAAQAPRHFTAGIAVR